VRRRRITLIDDSRETQLRFLASVQEEVELQAITVAPFFDDQVETAIKEFDPDLIVIDLHLTRSEESGFRVLRLLKESSVSNIPIVVCSRFISDTSEDANKAKALLLGAIAALPKFPFPTLQDLFKLLEQDESDIDPRLSDVGSTTDKPTLT